MKLLTNFTGSKPLSSLHPLAGGASVLASRGRDGRRGNGSRVRSPHREVQGVNATFNGGHSAFVSVHLFALLTIALGTLGCHTHSSGGRAPLHGSSHPDSTARQFHFGRHHFKSSTRSIEAQRAFDLGLTLAYAFSHAAAEKSFRRAAELDPGFALAWWGVALVNGPHINFPMVPPDRAVVAWEALGRATARAGDASPLERDLIAALAKRYAQPQPEDRAPLDRAYADAMRTLWQKYPRDPDLGTLFAEAAMDLRPWDLWRADGQPQPGTSEIVQ